jgi:predicted ATP-binding protein involved in virulence
MKLVFREKHLSISQFNPIEISDFTVLTGVNGSGKSHLLDAIEKRKVVIEGMDNERIVLFNYETFKLENEGAFNAQQLASEREAALNYFNQQIRNNITSWRQQIGENYPNLKKTCTDNKEKFWEINTVPELNQLKQNVKNYFSDPSIKSNPYSKGIYSMMRELPYSIDEIEKDDFLSLYKPYNLKNDFLPQELGKVIWDYYIKYDRNQSNEYHNKQYNKNYPILSEEQFVEKHGEKPWEVFNRVLSKFDSLEYRFSSPEGLDVHGNYQLKLVHTKIGGLEVEFSSLSSGERVLMALVASVYKTSTDKNFPDIILLDELDASLHPSMMKNMLAVIKDIFLDRGIKIILVTHSPTTIALSPDESIYVMAKHGLDRISKKSQQEALAILTEGFATLDEGIMIFDAVVKNPISIITEGKNTLLIQKALDFYDIKDVKIITDIEDVSGKDQLKTLFDFFCRANHKNKVIFVWDCDVRLKLQEQNQTYPYIFDENTSNTISKKGIENLFPENHFDGFIRTMTDSKGNETRSFDESRKKDFTNYILDRNEKADFIKFESLINRIIEIRTI